MIWGWLDSLRNSSTRWFRSSFHLSRLSNRRRNRTSKFLECTFHCHIGIDLVRIRLFLKKKIFRIINSNFSKKLTWPCAANLIGPITTIILTITYSALVNTLSIGTGSFRGSTCPERQNSWHLTCQKVQN